MTMIEKTRSLCFFFNSLCSGVVFSKIENKKLFSVLEGDKIHFFEELFVRNVDLVSQSPTSC